MMYEQSLKIDLFKMEELFKSYQGKPVTIFVKGTITLAIPIKSFDWRHWDDEVCFGEEEMQDDWFCINKDELVSIHTDYDLMGSEDKVIFETVSDIFRTDIVVVYECMR